MAKVKLYLIGDQSSPSTNSWLAMTNDSKQIPELLESIPGACTYKSIIVKDGGDHRGGNDNDSQ